MIYMSIFFHALCGKLRSQQRKDLIELFDNNNRMYLVNLTLPETNIAMENPPFWWYLPGKMGIFMGYVSFREGTLASFVLPFLHFATWTGRLVGRGRWSQMRWGPPSYCWWLKSGDHQLRLVVFPIIYRVSAPSQVVQDFSHQQYQTSGGGFFGCLHGSCVFEGWATGSSINHLLRYTFTYHCITMVLTSVLGGCMMIWPTTCFADAEIITARPPYWN